MGDTTSILGTTPFSASAGTSYSLRFQVQGTTLSAKVWQSNGAEPADWMLTVPDSAFSSGYCGIRALPQSGITASYTSFVATSLSGSATSTPTAAPTATSGPTATPTATNTPTSTATPAASVTPTPSAGITNYSYDSLYRLTGVSGGSSESYTYDPVGNRASMGGTTYSYDRADRITSVGSTTYTVDANGNLTARGSDSFTYDQANRLKTASVNGTSSTYVYDGDGKRASKTVGTTQTSYTYDVNASLPILLDDGTHKYVWGLGVAFAVDQAGNPLVYHTDGLGSVRALTDSSGNVVQTYQYDEYGNVVASQGSITQPFGYTGEERDPETGFTYLRARMYDSNTGRFLERDALGGFKAEPPSLQRYAYVQGNPVTSRDPTGLICIGPMVGGTAEAGLATFGGAVTGSGALGQCTGGSEGTNAGILAQGGYYANGLSGDQFGEQARGGNTTVGAFMGVGGGGFLSNATDMYQLEGPFDTTSLDVSVFPFPYKFSAQFAYSGDIWMVSVTFGPGEGLAASRLVTRAVVLWSTQKRNDKR